MLRKATELADCY